MTGCDDEVFRADQHVLTEYSVAIDNECKGEWILASQDMLPPK